MRLLSRSATNKTFAALVCFSIVAFWKPLWTLGHFSLQSEQYSHILLIPFVVLALFYQDRDKLFSKAVPDWTLGGAALGVAAFPYAVSLYLRNSLSENDRLSLVILSILLVWLALFLSLYGRRTFRAAAFPLCFMFLMVPIPEAILDTTIRLLQQASGEVTDILFQISGIPVYRQGLVFVLPNVTIEVAKECSGIRSSLALFITSLLAGHMFLRSTSRKILLCAVVLPITVFKNGLRIVVLSALAVYVDPAILDSSAHRRGGIPFFGLALLLLGAVLWLLQKTERGRTAKLQRPFVRKQERTVRPVVSRIEPEG